MIKFFFTIFFLLILANIGHAQNAKVFRVSEGFVNKNPKNENWEKYNSCNGKVLVWDLKRNKVTTYFAVPTDYIITNVGAIDLLKKDGMLVVHMNTVNASNDAIVIDLVRYEKAGRVIKNEVILDFKVFKMKFTLNQEI
jgi:hypothetical protein